MYDKEGTGLVHYEDFRNMAEQFGMQLDDDSLLALYMVYDPEGSGYLNYHDLSKHLMDKGERVGQKQGACRFSGVSGLGLHQCSGTNSTAGQLA